MESQKLGAHETTLPVVSPRLHGAIDRDEHGDTKTRLALVDERPLRRACISVLLQTIGPEFAISSFSDATDLLSGCVTHCEEPALILLSIGGADVSHLPVREGIRQLRRALAKVPLVILSDCDDPARIGEAFSYGVRGYLPTTINPPVAIDGLKLVLAGGAYVPADLVSMGTTDQLSAAAMDMQPDSVRSTMLDGLTPREREVFEWLRQGKSNKAIAYELQMRESTVKIHVRHILQRLKVTNRTRAALVAYQARVS